MSVRSRFEPVAQVRVVILEQIRVDPQREPRISVPQSLLQHLDVRARLDCQAGVGVAQIVDSPSISTRDTSTLQRGPKHSG